MSYSLLVTRLIAVVGTLSVLALTADAAAQTCVDNSAELPTSENRFRINYKYAGSLGSGFTNNQFKYAVLQAANQWNSTANGGWLTYDGDVVDSDINISGCSEDWSLIRVMTSDDEDEASGVRCNSTTTNTAGYFKRKGSCANPRWLVTVCVDYPDGMGTTAWNWSHIPTASNHRNLVHTLAHEMGHTLGLGHTSGSDHGIMNPSGIPDHGTLRGRYLYPWEVYCHEDKHGRRSKSFVYVQQNHGSTSFGSALTAGSGYTRGVGGVRLNGSTPVWSTVGYDYRFRNSLGDNMSGGITNFLQQYVGIAHTNFVPIELSSQWHTYYNYDYDSANRYQNSASKSNIYQYNYDLTFTSSSNGSARMRFCTNGPPSCTLETIYASQPISMAHDTFSSRTVYVWVNHNRSYTHSAPGEDRQIWISVGQRGISNYNLNKPLKLLDSQSNPVRSSTNAAVACGPYQSAGTYDCIIAYTPLNTTASSKNYAMKTRRFWVNTVGADNYTISLDSTEHDVGWLNGSDVAVWYNAGHYWIAHKTGEFVRVRRSLDGASWSHFTSLGTSITAPQAVTVGRDSNRTTRVYMTR